jgi:hypothetical protein
MVAGLKIAGSRQKLRLLLCPENNSRIECNEGRASIFAIMKCPEIHLGTQMAFRLINAEGERRRKILALESGRSNQASGRAGFQIAKGKSDVDLWQRKPIEHCFAVAL